mmetsp:Transcript_95856/g.222221  ORF Transcript_95856/g.222221 Transcript_95856/m.222221 type:complete len:310 (-) Transcript_95856:43-972(-)
MSPFCSSVSIPSMSSKLLEPGSPAHSCSCSSSGPDSSVTAAKKSLTCLSLSSRTFSAVSYSKEYLPSESTRMALCATCRPLCSSKVSAMDSACARFVKPCCQVCSRILVRTKPVSFVRGCTLMAGETVAVPFGTASTLPLPKRTTPTCIASMPKYSGLYFCVKSAANCRKIPKPVSPKEPLASSAMTRSCCAMQISSPRQSWVLHAWVWRRRSLLSFGHLPWPRMGTKTSRTLVCTPWPSSTAHAMEQGDQLLQACRVQSWSQDAVLQGRSSWTEPHASPPYRSLVRTDRVRASMPPPHSFEHLDQPDH